LLLPGGSTYRSCLKLWTLLQAHWAEEAALRQQFLQQPSPETNAEFINGQVVRHSPAKARHILVPDNVFRILSLFVLSRQPRGGMSPRKSSG
ncbi:MAG: hypothetical protein N2035_10620, partial [Chthoniobacterales bacterium]|nr:hypothetical protein [Chthoniobacterales bacterium]